MSEHVDVISGQACIDCTMMLANGCGTDEERAHAETMETGWVNACPDECEGFFSWRACDVCGTTLGGDRHPVAWFPPTEVAK